MKKRESTKGTGPEQQQPAAESEAPPQTAEPAEPDALQRKVAELEERNLRLMADARNLQQRAQRDQAEALKYAEADFARDLLVVIDDLERTQESAQTAESVPALADGVRIVYEHFLKVLKARNITQIEAEGRPFDPALHEAILQQPSAEHPAGTIIQEIARGYRMHDRVLRASQVIVSSGPPGDTAGDENAARPTDAEEPEE